MKDLKFSHRRAAALLMVMAHPVRLQILIFLAEGEQNIERLLQATGVTPSLLSQHLKVIRNAQLILRFRQQGHVLYRLKSKTAAKLLETLARLDWDAEDV